LSGPTTYQCGTHDTWCNDEGQCAVRPNLGEPCKPYTNKGFPPCLPGIVCDPTAKVCVERPGVGEPCIENRCAMDLECTNGVCSPHPGHGQDCKMYCAEPYGCDLSTHTCTVCQ
jgi:hypothetical protein